MFEVVVEFGDVQYVGGEVEELFVVAFLLCHRLVGYVFVSGCGT